MGQNLFNEPVAADTPTLREFDAAAIAGIVLKEHPLKADFETVGNDAANGVKDGDTIVLTTPLGFEHAALWFDGEDGTPRIGNIRRYIAAANITGLVDPSVWPAVDDYGQPVQLTVISGDEIGHYEHSGISWIPSLLNNSYTVGSVGGGGDVTTAQLNAVLAAQDTRDDAQDVVIAGNKAFADAQPAIDAAQDAAIAQEVIDRQAVIATEINARNAAIEAERVAQAVTDVAQNTRLQAIEDAATTATDEGTETFALDRLAPATGIIPQEVQDLAPEDSEAKDKALVNFNDYKIWYEVVAGAWVQRLRSKIATFNKYPIPSTEFQFPEVPTSAEVSTWLAEPAQANIGVSDYITYVSPLETAGVTKNNHTWEVAADGSLIHTANVDNIGIGSEAQRLIWGASNHKGRFTVQNEPLPFDDGLSKNATYNHDGVKFTRVAEPTSDVVEPVSKMVRLRNGAYVEADASHGLAGGETNLTVYTRVGLETSRPFERKTIIGTQSSARYTLELEPDGYLRSYLRTTTATFSLLLTPIALPILPLYYPIWIKSEWTSGGEQKISYSTEQQSDVGDVEDWEELGSQSVPVDTINAVINSSPFAIGNTVPYNATRAMDSEYYSVSIIANGAEVLNLSPSELENAISYTGAIGETYTVNTAEVDATAKVLDEVYGHSLETLNILGTHGSDLLDYKLSRTDGVANLAAWNKCRSENESFYITNPGFIIPIAGNMEWNKYMRVHGRGMPTFRMLGDSWMGWDGTDATVSLTDFSVSGVQLFGESTRSDTAAFFRLVSAGSIDGVPNATGKDAARFEVDDLKILGTSKTGIGVELLGCYTGRMLGLRVSQCAQGYNLMRGPKTSYGCNSVDFISCEIQGCKKIGHVEDFKRVSFQGTEQGAEEGVTIVGPGEGLDINVYHELVGRSDDPDKQYSHYLKKGPLGEKPQTVVFAPTCYFVAPVEDVNGAPLTMGSPIWIEGGQGVEFNGNIIRYFTSFVRNMATAVDDVIGEVRSVIDDYSNPRSPSALPAIDKPTAQFFWRDDIHRQDVVEVPCGTVDTLLAEYDVPALGFHSLSSPVTLKMNGRLLGQTLATDPNPPNKIMTLRVNDVVVPGFSWISDSVLQNFTLELNLHGRANNSQVIYGTVNNFGGTNPSVRRAALAVNTLNTPLKIGIYARCATAGQLVKETFSYDNGRR